jgi:hypothetical protein
VGGGAAVCPPIPTFPARGEGMQMPFESLFAPNLEPMPAEGKGWLIVAFPLHRWSSRMPEGGLLVGMGDLQQEPVFKGAPYQLQADGQLSSLHGYEPARHR